LKANIKDANQANERLNDANQGLNKTNQRLNNEVQKLNKEIEDLKKELGMRDDENTQLQHNLRKASDDSVRSANESLTA